jgi:hypothetical protein
MGEKERPKRPETEIYYYPDDCIALKYLSKKQHKSMTRVAHDALIIYRGYQHGVTDGEIAHLEDQLLLMTRGYKKRERN